MSTTSESGRSLPLFDPNGGQPPADAVELYLEAPRSIGVLYAAAASSSAPERRQRNDALVQAVDQIQRQALDRVVQLIKRDGGYAKVGEHVRVGNGQPTLGRYLPATLYLTALSHKFADQRTDVTRFHEHIYVGGRALVDDDGRDWPLDLGSLKNVLSMAQVRYADTWEDLTTDLLGVEWRTVPGLDSVEIVNPPMHEHVRRYPHVMCSGPFQLRQRWISRDVMSPEETRHADAV